MAIKATDTVMGSASEDEEDPPPGAPVVPLPVETVMLVPREVVEPVEPVVAVKLLVVLLDMIGDPVALRHW